MWFDMIVGLRHGLAAVDDHGMPHNEGGRVGTQPEHGRQLDPSSEEGEILAESLLRDPFSELAPVWTEEFMAAEIMIYTSGVMPPKLIDLLNIAFNTSYTHMYAQGTRRHIKAALRHGATIAEIIEVLKVCVVQGVQAFNLGVPILAKELANRSAQKS